MRIGIVSPYSFSVPGGVQAHIRDITRELVARGHAVSVFGPGHAEDLPQLVSAGGTVSVPFNGSIARLSFGPTAQARTRAWLNEGDFDLVHIHEPFAPSLTLLALAQAECPIVATFHTANERSWAYLVFAPVLAGLSERINARIAVSAEARRTLVEHEGGDAVIIPNGVYVDAFASAPPRREWQGSAKAPTFVFLGRLDEERKGLPVLAGAVPKVLERFPGARFFIAGRGEAEGGLGDVGGAVKFLGAVSDADKASLLRSVDAYVAPQTGGESFGIVLVEAMAAGTLCVASDIPAFQAVLRDGRAGRLFAVGDSQALARTLIDVADDRAGSARLAAAGHAEAARYDWARVTDQVIEVYETVLAAASTPTTLTRGEPDGS